MEELGFDKNGLPILSGSFVEVLSPLRTGRRRLKKCKQLSGKAVCTLNGKLFLETSLRRGQAVFFACRPDKVRVIQDPEMGPE